MPCTTAGTNTGTWLPSLMMRPRPGLSWRPRRPRLPLCGWAFTTPAPWSSGSGSMIIAWNSIAGFQRRKQKIVTGVLPWRQKRNITGSASLMTRSLISSVQSKRNQCFVFLSSYFNSDDCQWWHCCIVTNSPLICVLCLAMSWRPVQHLWMKQRALKQILLVFNHMLTVN